MSDEPEETTPPATMYRLNNPKTDAFIADWQAGIDAGQDEGSAMFAAMAMESQREEAAAVLAWSDDAKIIDTDITAFPLDPAPTIVRATKHALAITGYSTAQLDDIFQAEPGTAQSIVDGNFNRFSISLYGSYEYLLFINVSRRVVMTFPGQSVKQWWETPAKGKRLTPLDLLTSRRLRKAQGQPYLDALHCNGQVCSQLVASGGNVQYIEFNFGITFR